MNDTPSKQPNQNKGSCAFWMITAMFLAAALLHFFPNALTPERPPMLPEAEGLIEVVSAEKLTDRFGLTPPTPTTDFQGEIEEIGLYRNGGPGLSKNAVLTIYQNGGRRTVEITYQPEKQFSDIEKRYDHLEQETVEIGLVDGKLLDIDPSRSGCLPRTEDALQTCPISRVLFFEHKGYLISIAADGSYLTDGQMIKMARSMAQ